MFKAPAVYVLDKLAGKFRRVGTKPFTHCVVCRTGTPACWFWERSSPTTKADADATALELCAGAGLAGVAFSVIYSVSITLGLPTLYDASWTAYAN